MSSEQATAAQSADPLPTWNEDLGCADEFARGRRRSWARMIKKVYEADPLVCPRCSGPLKIISLIGDVKLWDRPERPPPPRRCPTMEPDTDFLDWAAMARQFDGID